MNINALLEIGTEEIPARFMPGLLADLQKKAEEKLSANRLTFSKIETLGTPRRLVLYIEGLLGKQPDVIEEVQGPPAEIAFDKDNKPTKAAAGFAKKCGVKVENLSIRTVNGKNYVYATIKKKGLSAEKIMTSLFPEIISSLYLPLAMRWGDHDFKFIRPIHWIVALCGDKIIKFELTGIKASNITRGHRYLKNSKIKIQNSKLNDYIKKLHNVDVVVDQQERMELVRKSVEAAAKKAKGKALIEEDLLTEVAYLVENPIAYVGEFREEFLSLPQEVLITSMKKNQKYFPILDERGKLSSKFVIITDNCKNKGVVEGNHRVISARLSDAIFFFNEDKKIPLRARIADLKRVEFFEKLGSMLEKTERVKKLSHYLARHLKIDESILNKIESAADLIKADLTTHMVFEFPELQGIMGREYALISGEDAGVACAIFEHYLPRFAEDKLPESIPGIVISLADKIDTLVGCFLIGKIPTGSEDPYGLRRAAHGMVKIVLEKKLDLMLDEIFEHSLHAYNREGVDSARLIRQLLDFIGGRLKVIMLDEKIPADVIEAALCGFNDILEAKEVSLALVLNRKADWFAGIAATESRIMRIAKDVKREQVIEADLSEPEEKDLHTLYLAVNWNVSEKINAGNYNEALLELSRLTQPIENFFQKVMVMHEDERLKLNRLALLKSIEKTFLKVADFTKLQISA